MPYDANQGNFVDLANTIAVTNPKASIMAHLVLE
jgi:hypothetical protein